MKRSYPCTTRVLNSQASSVMYCDLRHAAFTVFENVVGLLSYVRSDIRASSRLLANCFAKTLLEQRYQNN